MSRSQAPDFLNVQDPTQPYVPAPANQSPSEEPMIPQFEHESNPRCELTIQVSHGYLSDDIVDDQPTQYNNFTCDDSSHSHRRRRRNGLRQ